MKQKLKLKTKKYLKQFSKKKKNGKLIARIKKTSTYFIIY